jgi:hypothetical protein
MEVRSLLDVTKAEKSVQDGLSSAYVLLELVREGLTKGLDHETLKNEVLKAFSQASANNPEREITAESVIHVLLSFTPPKLVEVASFAYCSSFLGGWFKK